MLGTYFVCVLVSFLNHPYSLESDTVIQLEAWDSSGSAEMKGKGFEGSNLEQPLRDAEIAVMLQPLWGMKEAVFSWTRIIWDEVEPLFFSTYRNVHCPQLQHANSKCV